MVRSSSDACIQHLAARFVERARRRVEASYLFFQATQEIDKGLLRKRIASFALHESLGAKEVRIHQAGEYHARQKRKRIGSVLPIARNRQNGRAFRNVKLDFARIGGAIGDATVLCPQQSTAQSRTVFDICRSAPVGKPCMMAGNAVSEQFQTQLIKQSSPRRGVIDFMPVA